MPFPIALFPILATTPAPPTEATPPNALAILLVGCLILFINRRARRY